MARLQEKRWIDGLAPGIPHIFTYSMLRVQSLCRLPMIHQNSLRFYDDIAYDTYNGLVLDDSEGKKLAGDCSSSSLMTSYDMWMLVPSIKYIIRSALHGP